ncbi:hypothetical protein D9757_001562 [Collybiopsis confluens]|uniref:Cyclin N-terminal domain-containing protein n=1 Tax=Collybiopsis confluens TaxID=2823264 RepID=A0A8H5I079_9AGAR|nr:hypothetical protein D9757_001562 [Collybiopsis confluens]
MNITSISFCFVRFNGPGLTPAAISGAKGLESVFNILFITMDRPHTHALSVGPRHHELDPRLITWTDSNPKVLSICLCISHSGMLVVRTRMGGEITMLGKVFRRCVATVRSPKDMYLSKLGLKTQRRGRPIVHHPYRVSLKPAFVVSEGPGEEILTRMDFRAQNKIIMITAKTSRNSFASSRPRKTLFIMIRSYPAGVRRAPPEAAPQKDVRGIFEPQGMTFEADEDIRGEACGNPLGIGTRVPEQPPTVFSYWVKDHEVRVNDVFGCSKGEQICEEDTESDGEYAIEILEYMAELAEKLMPKAEYMNRVQAINPDHRRMVVNKMQRIHDKCSMQPDTLWMGVNVLDRFLSKYKLPSEDAMSSVGVASLLIAAKYEENFDRINILSKWNIHSREVRCKVFKWERCILEVLEFEVYNCSPYRWMSRVHRGSGYDPKMTELSEFLVEVTLTDTHFIGCKPCLIAAVGSYGAWIMLGKDWNDLRVHYSEYSEAQLLPCFQSILWLLRKPSFDTHYVYRKYTRGDRLQILELAERWAQNHSDSDST